VTDKELLYFALAGMVLGVSFNALARSAFAAGYYTAMSDADAHIRKLARDAALANANEKSDAT
jgi:hypothetical protein